MINNEIDIINNYYIGRVMKSDPVTRKVYCYIPRLMMGLSGTSIYSKSVSSKKKNIKNIDQLNVSNTLKKSNIFAVSARDVDEPLPEVGSLVLIYFLDNLENCYWIKHNHNGSYKVIESERYPELFKISINDKEIAFNKSDKVKFSIPDDLNIIVLEDKENKTKEIKLEYSNDNEQSISTIKEEFATLKENMEYYVSTIKSSVVSDLNNLLTDSLQTDNALIYDKVQNDLESVNEINSIKELMNIKEVDDAIVEYNTEAKSLYDNYKTWYSDSKNNASNYDNLLNLTESETLYTAYKSNSDDYNTASNYIDKIRDNFKLTRTLNYYYKEKLLGSKSYELLSAFSRTLPDDIQTELNEYQKELSVNFHGIRIEGFYEDKNYSERIPDTYTTVDKNIDIYIGAVEVSVVKNESDYDIFVYSQQPVSGVSLNSTTLSEYTTNTNPLIKQYKVTESPDTKTLTVTLMNETSVNFTIYIGAVKVTVVQNETNYEIQVYSKQSISKVSLNTTTLTEDTTNVEPLTKKYNVTESPSGKALTVTLMNETSINFTINL